LNQNLSVLGVGGHARVVLDLALQMGFSIDAFYDDDPQRWGLDFFGFKIKGPIDKKLEGSACIAIGDNKIRKSIFKKMSFADWPILVHPSSIVSKDVLIGEGSIIMAGVILQSGVKIGNHCIINTGACIDHDVIIGDFVHVAPNCSLAGGVSVGEGTFIGIGSSIIPNKTIGSWTNVGAGSVIITDQPDNCTTLGVPAKPIKFINEQK